MMWQNREIKNIVFDLGNVIVDIDVPGTIKRLEDLLGLTFHNARPDSLEVFRQYEKGQISEEDFLDRLIELASKENVEKHHVADAWVSMLLDIPERRIRMVEELKKKYRVLALSNINTLHADWCDFRLMNVFGIESIEALFHESFLSHEVQHRKPEPAIFQHLIDESGIEPGKTLYVDDTLEHVQAGLKAGLLSVHLQHGKEIIDLMEEFGLYSGTNV